MQLFTFAVILTAILSSCQTKKKPILRLNVTIPEDYRLTYTTNALLRKFEKKHKLIASFCISDTFIAMYKYK